MANNRLFVVCKGCGDEKLLLKYYPTGGWYPVDFSFSEWIEKHTVCYLDANPHTDINVGGEPFSIVYESSPGWHPAGYSPDVG